MCDNERGLISIRFKISLSESKYPVPLCDNERNILSHYAKEIFCEIYVKIHNR